MKRSLKYLLISLLILQITTFFPVVNADKTSQAASNPCYEQGFLASSNYNYNDIYSYIKSNFINHNKSIDMTAFSLSYTKDQKSLVDTIYDVLQDNPELFYINPNVNMFGELKLVNGYSYVFIITKIEIQYVENINFDEFNKAVKYIISKNIQPNMTNEEKILAIHDYLMDNLSYDNSVGLDILGNPIYPIESYTSYGAIMNKTSVSQGYSLAFGLILNLLGIENKIVVSSSLNHTWNAVCLGGNWYHIDLSKDDLNFSHYMFLVSDTKIKEKGNTSWDTILPAPCTDTKYESNYPFNSSDIIFHYYDGLFWFTKDGLNYTTTFSGNFMQQVSSDNLAYQMPKIQIYNPIIYSANSVTLATPFNLNNADLAIEIGENLPTFADLYIAFYSQDGELIGLNEQQVNLGSSEGFDVISLNAIAPLETYNAKIMLLDEINPVCESVLISE